MEHAEQVAQRVLELNLLDQRQLDAAWGEFGTRDVPAEEFQKLLVRRELLTNYQVERLLKGERNGFFYGDFKVLYLVGAGTFARVYRAVHNETGKVVCVKVLRRRFSEDAVKTDQFIREGKMGMSLRHPNIVPIHDVCVQKPFYFIVMDFVEGQNLREFLKVRKKLDPIVSTNLIADVAAGLDYAAKQGVTHRDLKLSNILVSSIGRAQLVDFGLAGITEVLTEDELAQCANPRTVDYAGLERATGTRKDDARSDIYFAGCIFYNMLTGEPPLFETKDRIQRLSVSRFQNVVSITKLEPTLPQRIVMIVKKAMELDPNRRFGSPAEMLIDLKRAAQYLQAESEVRNEFQYDGVNSGVGHSVMIVESNAKVQNALRNSLRKRGYRVLVMSDPSRATHRFEADDYVTDCVIFSSGGLGKSALDGFNEFGQLPHTKNVPSILLLDKRHQEWTESADVAGHRVVVPMPIKMKEFEKVLGKLVTST